MARQELSSRQQLFVQEYLVDSNATQAAIRAGYSAKWADRQGHQLLEKARVKAAIAAARQKRIERTEVTADWVVERLRIESLGGNEASRVAALRVLAQHLGMLVDKHEITGAGGGPLRTVVVEDESWYGNDAHQKSSGGNNRFAQSAPPSNNGSH